MYNCPCAKEGKSKSTPQTFNDWPCDLFMVIAKARRTENGRCLKSNGKSLGMDEEDEDQDILFIVFSLGDLDLDDIIQ